jgi:hypothetical protein
LQTLHCFTGFETITLVSWSFDTILTRATSQVNAGINNDGFLKNVTIHLASQIQPILKGTLDLSGIESKLLTSNGQLLQRIDEAKVQTVGDLESLSSLIDISNTTSTSRLSAIEVRIFGERKFPILDSFLSKDG